MIRFALVCENGHGFESWFASNDSYDFQIENNLVSCPHCNAARGQGSRHDSATTRAKTRAST